MRKHLMFAIIMLLGTFALGGCQNSGDQTQQGSQTAAAPARPSSAGDTKAWQNYLISKVSAHMEGMTAKRPYLYFVPAGDSPAAQGQRDLQLDQVTDTVLRTVLPGNLLAFGGPDSSTTADFISQAFSQAAKGSFKNVIVMFVGDAADKDRVAKALAPSGATYRFVQM
ncbi:MAG TPA: hypothetical protein VFG73_01240 [Rhodanobacteraceae bacterium]|nr:hypothetical protein [Rhodanobacteraceae bacterium]